MSMDMSNICGLHRAHVKCPLPLLDALCATFCLPGCTFHSYTNMFVFIACAMEHLRLCTKCTFQRQSLLLIYLRNRDADMQHGCQQAAVKQAAGFQRICRSNRKPQFSQRQRIGRVPFRFWLHHSPSAGLPKSFLIVLNGYQVSLPLKLLGKHLQCHTDGSCHSSLRQRLVLVMSKAYLWVNGCLKLCQAVFAVHKLDLLLCHLHLDTSGVSQDAVPHSIHAVIKQ